MEPKQNKLPETRWTLLEAVKAGGNAATGARAELAELYREPVCAYIGWYLRRTNAPRAWCDLAEDLTQGFFLQKFDRILQKVQRRECGFRPYLKRVLKHYVISEVFRKGRPRETEITEIMKPGADSGHDGPESEFDCRCTWGIFDRALVEIAAIYAANGGEYSYELFKKLVFGDPRSWTELGAPYNLTGPQAEKRAWTVRRRFLGLFYECLVADLGSGEAARREILAVLAAPGGGRHDSPSDRSLPSGGIDLHVREPDDLARLMALAAAPNSLDELLRIRTTDVVVAHLLTALGGADRDVGGELLRAVAAPDATLESLRELKELAKHLAARAKEPAHRTAATFLYHAANAAALVRHGANISTIPMDDRVQVYARLAAGLGSQPLGAVFDAAARRPGT